VNEPNPEKTIFAAARQLPPEDRAAYLDEACGDSGQLRCRIEALLNASEQSGAFLEVSAAATLRRIPAASIPLAEKPGDRVGRYKLLQQIGEGGCGVVYMAEQEEPVRRRVALKIIKLGMDTRNVITRFEAERQALAMMDHPNIAKVFDAGATETGRPYFVMELVRGVKITNYCDETQLSIRTRLGLFTQVCQAIQHAHQKGIIHRDIKPSNILVTVNDGVPVPKVIDFGIAKATGGQQLTDKTVFTAFEQFIGTPAYMSPEQALMTSLDIDTRSDIYALGVLLYELLTGKTPFDAKELLAVGLDEMRRTIREKEPERPSTRLSTLPDNELSTTARSRGLEAPKLISQLRGDLDWIVMKCLEKDRARRYETANGLAADIQRHLSEEPVLACPPSPLYRLHKLLRRNKLAYAAASAVMAALLLGLTLSAILFFKEKAALARAVAERQRADEQAAIAKAVNEFLQNDLLKQAVSGEQADRGFEQQPDLTVKEALRRASDRASQRFTNQPAVEAEIRQTLGNAFAGLSEWKLAIPNLERAFTLRKQLAGPDAPESLSSMTALAKAYGSSGRIAESIALSEEALKRTKSKLGAEHPDTITRMGELASMYGEAGRFSEEVPLFEEALKLSKGQLGATNRATLERMNDLAIAYQDAGRLDESLRLQEETMRLAKVVLGPDHPNMLTGMKNLAGTYYMAGRLEQALPVLEATLTLSKAKLGADHQQTLRVMNLLAMTYRDAGRLDDAVRLQEESLRLNRAKLGPDHPDTLINMNNVAEAYRAAGRIAEAVSLHEETLKLTRAKLGADHPDTLRSMHNLALAYQDAGRLDEALRLHKEMFEASKAKLGIDHPFTLGGMSSLLNAYLGAGRLTDAEGVLKDIVAPALAIQPDSPDLLRVRAMLLARTGQWPQAAADLERVIALRPESHEDWQNLAAIFVQMGEIARYQENCRKSLDRFANATEPQTAHQAAKSCLLLPDSGANLALVSKLVDRSLMVGTNNSRWPMYSLTKALAEYRQGKFASAADWVERALSARTNVPPANWPPCLDGESYSVLAMARHQLKQNDLADVALASGEEIAANKLPKLETGDLGENWLNWIIAQALVREAKAMVEGGPETGTPAK
jgi:eukaryotic-like serine/threonine-protein kinase